MKVKTKIIITLCALVVCLTMAYFCLDKIAQTILSGLEAKDKVTIVVDAGHGGIDAGCIGITGALEKEINLAITMDLADMLRLGGYNVVLTRSNDKEVSDKNAKGIREKKETDIYNRLDIIEESNAAAFVMIHQNKYIDSQYSGAQMFYNETTPGAEEFADVLQRAFVNNLQPENTREIKECEGSIYLLCQSQVPGVLVECGFLSNANEEALLSNRDYQRKVAFTVYNGITEYLNTYAG